MVKARTHKKRAKQLIKNALNVLEGVISESLFQETEDTRIKHFIEVRDKSHDYAGRKRHHHRISYADVNIYLDLYIGKKKETGLVVSLGEEFHDLEDVVLGLVDGSVFKELIPRDERLVKKYQELYSDISLEEQPDRTKKVYFQINPKYANKVLSNGDTKRTFKKSIADFIVLPFLCYSRPWRNFLEKYLEKKPKK